MLKDGSEDEEMALFSSSSDTVPVRTSPEALVSSAAALLSLVEPESKADPGGINSSSGRVAREDDSRTVYMNTATFITCILALGQSESFFRSWRLGARLCQR